MSSARTRRWIRWARAPDGTECADHQARRERPHGVNSGHQPGSSQHFIFYVFYLSRKWPNAASGRTPSQLILAIASMGTERIAPGIPHIQNQKTSEMMTRTGLRVNRLARSIGVTVSPSIK